LESGDIPKGPTKKGERHGEKTVNQKRQNAGWTVPKMYGKLNSKTYTETCHRGSRCRRRRREPKELHNLQPDATYQVLAHSAMKRQEAAGSIEKKRISKRSRKGRPKRELSADAYTKNGPNLQALAWVAAKNSETCTEEEKKGRGSLREKAVKRKGGSSETSLVIFKF